MKKRSVVQRIHRWLALLLGAQVVLWMLSGVFMSWFHINLVRGETNSSVDFPTELLARNYAAPGGVIAQMDFVTDVRLTTFLGKPVYQVTDSNGVALFSASTSARISPISKSQAQEVAETDFIGDGEVVSVERLIDPPGEYRGKKPVWRVTFDDRLSTRIYISPDTGEISARRNVIWRVYDFFWMLHIMDYGDRENFNNPLVRAASVTGLLFAGSGLFLLIIRLRNNRFADDINRIKSN